MTEATLREQMYRRWKKGEDYFVLAKEMGVTRERMRLILKKMDAEVPLVDRIDAQAAEIERLRGALTTCEKYRDAYDEMGRIGTQAVRDLEANLAKAVNVIDWALICWDDRNKHGYNMQGDWVSDARAIVAALTGAKP